ncbi:MAG: family 78 glycoside hydrolase catalytic domain [Bacteroidales bacterium]|nr:family 78 glycoside hydrolase catalytic domain [Candidatus Cryptobacteroides faecihippi]
MTFKRICKALAAGIITVLLTQTGMMAGVKAKGLRCEFTVDPECIDAQSPRLSWIMESGARGDRQTAYQILVASSRKELTKRKADIWNTGKVESGESVSIEYSGARLESMKDYYWKVRVWNADGKASRWSKPARWSMGLLSKDAWKGAEWIAFKDRETWQSEWNEQKEIERQTSVGMIPGESWPWANWKDSSIFTIWEMTDYDPSPLFRKEFTTVGKVRKADLYICGLGYYIPYLNGKRVGDRELNPAWTNFDQRSIYDRYDVTDLIEGDNAIGVMLGRGQYEPICNDIWGLCRSSWVDEPKVIALLKIEYSDGRTEYIKTDASWKTAGGPVIYDDTRHGELYDAREEKEGWDRPGFDDSQWAQASLIPFETSLQAQVMPPVRKFAPLNPVRVIDSYLGSKVYDIGKEIAGWARVTVKGARGTRVLVEYCERPSNKDICPDLAPSCYVYDKKDPLYASFYDKCINVRQQNGYIMKGEGEETFECMFSYKGFQYIRVWADSDIEIVGVEGIPVHTDFETNGSFRCSDEVVNTLQQNSINSMLSNFVSIPTDCPHREKQGWTCDTYIVSKATMYNFNMALFFEKWVRDLALSETPQGGYVTVAPSTGYDGNTSTTWPAALVYVPTDMLHFYGDTKILSDNLRNMETFAASSRLHRELPGKPDIINDVLGDWISPHPTIDDSKPRHNDMAPPEGLPFYGTTSHYLVHRKLAGICKALGLSDKASYYEQRAKEIAGHFNDEFYDPETHSYHGTVPTGYRQSTNVTALYYGLVPEQEKDAVESELISQIKANDSHLGTGFLGIQSLMGYMPEVDPELTFQMVTQPTYPSWGYMVAKGANSMWETWDGYDSQNHLPFCSVSEYFYRHLAGIQFDEDAPGFRHTLIHPSFISSLDNVECHYDSVYGRIVSNWTRKDGRITLEVKIPAGTTADVILPENATGVKESGKAITEGRNGIISAENGRIVTGSGSYTFTFNLE